MLCISKAGVDALTRCLAVEFGPRKIRVNGVRPTACMTEMGKSVWDPTVYREKAEAHWDRIPSHRFAEVREVVGPILFLKYKESIYCHKVACKKFKAITWHKCDV